MWCKTLTGRRGEIPKTKKLKKPRCQAKKYTFVSLCSILWKDYIWMPVNNMKSLKCATSIKPGRQNIHFTGEGLAISAYSHCINTMCSPVHLTHQKSPQQPCIQSMLTCCCTTCCGAKTVTSDIFPTHRGTFRYNIVQIMPMNKMSAGSLHDYGTLFWCAMCSRKRTMNCHKLCEAHFLQSE